MTNPATETKDRRKPIRILVVEDNAGDVYLLEKRSKLANYIMS